MQYFEISVPNPKDSGNGQQRAVYQTNLVLPKIKNYLGVQWHYKVSQTLILIDLKLNSGGNFSCKLCQFLKNQSQIKQFTHLINNLGLCDSSGYFCFNRNTGELILRQKITNFRFLSSQSVLLKYFIRCIRKISKAFVEEIQQIIFYYKLCGITQTETQNYFQHQNHVPLMKQTQNINYLKKCFQNERSKRKHSSKQAIELMNQAPISSYIQILSPNSNISSKSEEKDKIQDNLNYKYELETLIKDITYRKMTETTHIVTGFKIKKVIKERQIASGGFSQIINGIYRYLPQISIYGNSQLPQFCQLKEQQKVIQNGLIKKVSKEGEDNSSLQNQCNFLVYIRNKVCPYIAQYYCKTQTKAPFADKQIYLECYPDHLGHSRQKQDTKLKIIEDVCFALLFLNEQKLIHRDLKQANIMVDRYHRAKLIDFGSVANIRGSKYFQEKDDIVRSTQGYFYPYRLAVKSFPQLRNFMSVDDYYTHQTFDLYSLGVILQNQFYLNQFNSESNFVRSNLKFLSDKCRQINPEDRWTVQQVCIFLRHLIIYYQTRRQFWNYGFDPRFKAHELGKFYNGNGSYNQRNKASVFHKKVDTSQDLM